MQFDLKSAIDLLGRTCLVVHLLLFCLKKRPHSDKPLNWVQICSTIPGNDRIN